MEGLKKREVTDITYLKELVYEYGIIYRNQIFTLLSRKEVNKARRKSLVKRLASSAGFNGMPKNTIEMEDIRLFPPPLLKERLKCLWVLFEYIDKVDYHYRLDYPPSVIGMQINGRDYEIIYLAKGKEEEAIQSLTGNRYELVKRMSLAQLKRFLSHQELVMADHIRYIAVIEEAEQMQNIDCEHIAMFCTIDSEGLIQYFVSETDSPEEII